MCYSAVNDYKKQAETAIVGLNVSYYNFLNMRVVTANACIKRIKTIAIKNNTLKDLNLDLWLNTLISKRDKSIIVQVHNDGLRYKEIRNMK